LCHHPNNLIYLNNCWLRLLIENNLKWRCSKTYTSDILKHRKSP